MGEEGRGCIRRVIFMPRVLLTADLTVFPFTDDLASVMVDFSSFPYCIYPFAVPSERNQSPNMSTLTFFYRTFL